MCNPHINYMMNHMANDIIPNRSYITNPFNIVLILEFCSHTMTSDFSFHKANIMLCPTITADILPINIAYLIMFI